MAEHADGSIIVDTEIDTEGFKAGSNKIQKAINSMNSKMKNLGLVLQKALSGNANALASFDSKAAALQDTISQLEAKLKSLGDTRVPTEDYQWLTDEIKKAENELNKLVEKEIKMSDMGVKKNSKAWQSLQYDIALAKRKIADYEAEQEQMRDAGTAFQMGSATAEFEKLSSELSAAKAKLADMQAQADSARGSTNKFAAAAKILKNVLVSIGKVGKKAFSGCVNALKKGISKIKQFTKASKGSTASINKFGKKITGLAGMLKRLALRKLMNGILTAVKEGFDNLAQYSTQTNKDLSALKSGLTQLKNSFATAFAPILTVVTPALTKLINYLSVAITYIGKLFAALTGATTFVKAKEVQEDYAASLEGTADAAQAAKKQLAGFDDLNVLSDTSKNENAETPPSDMFEEVPIESSITDFIGKLKQAFESGDYAGIGAAIGNGINTALQKVKDFISWDNVGGSVTEFVEGVAEGFNSMIDTVNWSEIGNTFSQGFNTVLNTLFLVLTAFDWLGLAEGLTNSINGFVDNVDWATVGKTISAGFVGALQFILTALETFDWQAFGSAVATLVANIDWSELFNTILKIVGEIFNGVLEFRKTLHDELPEDLRGVLQLVETIGLAIAAWKISSTLLDGINSIKELPTSVTVGVTLAITGITIEAKGIADAIQTELSGFNFAEIVGGALLTGGGSAALGAGLATWIESAFAGSAVDLAITQAGINLGVGTVGAAGAAIGAGVAGIIAGIPAMFVGIYDACTKEINWLNTALTGLGATAAGAGVGTLIGAAIGSVGGPMGAGIGALIGLAVGLVTDGILAIIDICKNGLNETNGLILAGITYILTAGMSGIPTIVALIVSHWDEIVECTKEIFTKKIPALWNSFMSWLGNLPNAISTWFSNLWQPIKDYDWSGLGYRIGAWLGNALKTAIDFVTVTVPTFFVNLWNSIKNAFVTFFTVTLPKFFTETLPAAFKAVVDFVKGLPEMLWNAIKTGWNWLVDIGKSIVDGIWEGLQTVWTAITDFVSGFVQGFKDALGIHSPSTVFAEIGRFIIEGLLQGIKNMWSSITSFFTNALASLQQTIANAWASIQQGAQAAWSGISSTVSNAWNGIKSATSTACTAVGGAISNAWSGIKSGASAAWSAVSSTVSNAWNGIKSGVSNACTNIANTASTAWNSIKTTASTIGSAIKTNVTSTWNSVKSSVSTALEGAKTAASTAWNSIKSTASTVCSNVKSTVSSAWSNVKSSVTTSVNNIKSTASSAWNSVKSTVSSVSSSIKSTVSSAWENTKSTVSSKLSSIKSTASSTFTSLKNSATTWGKDVCDNMANGISKAKSTVESAVKGVADKIKSFLGFSEPEDGPLSNFHTYMPDMIDLMTYGIKKNQGKVIGTVSGMASAISSEIQNGDYAMGNIKVGKNTTSALTGFSDKVADSFSSLMDRLQAIADGVTFATPVVAKGSVMPYSVAASTNAGGTGVTTAIEASNDELASVITQVVTNATTNIVNAIQRYSGTTVNFDKNSVTSSVIQEINRRTRMLGSSPLIH